MRAIAKLKIWRGTASATGRWTTYEVPFEPGQSVLFELAYAMPRDVHVQDGLFNRLRLAIGGDAIAKFEHPSLVFGQLNERLAERFSFKDRLDCLWGLGLLRHHRFDQPALLVVSGLVHAGNGTSRLLNLEQMIDGEAN